MKNNNLKASVLSISLLTVMASAAISPALGSIASHFSDVNPILIKFIITVPSLFIIISSMLFKRLSKHLTIKQLAILGTTLYTVGGVLAGIASNIYVMLILRAILGIGVGILMPLSTGLLAYFFNRDEQSKLMGYSSAMNNLGGVVATIVSGILANYNWRLSFFVYLIGVIVFVLICLYIPNDKLEQNNSTMNKTDYTKVAPYLLGMFILMLTFFSVPTNFALIAQKTELMPTHFVGVVMALQTGAAFIIGLSLTKIINCFKQNTGLVGFISLVLGLVSLCFMHNIVFSVIGLILVGVGIGICIPVLNSQMSIHLDRYKVPQAMAMMSVMMYSGHFLSPIIVDFITKLFNLHSNVAPFIVAAILTFISLFYIRKIDMKHN